MPQHLHWVSCKLVWSWTFDFYDVRIKQGHGRYQKIAYMECANKYYIEMYVDCPDTGKDNDKYIRDFMESVRAVESLVGIHVETM